MAADELLAQASDVLGAWPAYGGLPASEQTSLLNSASQMILNFCGHPFAQAGHDEFHDGRNLPRLWTRHKPIISIQSISMNGTPLDNTDGKGWSFNAKTGEVIRGVGITNQRFSRCFPPGTRNIEIKYWAGYAMIPDPIVRATIWTVKWMYEQGRISGIYSAERIGDYNYTLNQPMFLTMTLPAHIAALCANYVQDDGLI